MTTNTSDDDKSITALKQKLIETFLDRIANGIQVADKEGNVSTISCPTDILKIAAAFVKDFEKDVDMEKLMQTGRETSKIIDRFKSRAGVSSH